MTSSFRGSCVALIFDPPPSCPSDETLFLHVGLPHLAGFYIFLHISVGCYWLLGCFAGVNPSCGPCAPRLGLAERRRRARRRVRRLRERRRGTARLAVERDQPRRLEVRRPGLAAASNERPRRREHAAVQKPRVRRRRRDEDGHGAGGVLQEQRVRAVLYERMSGWS